MSNKTKYPWDFAPKWAEYAATDQNGDAWWYSERPNKYDVDWWSIRFGCLPEPVQARFFCHDSPHAADWQNSLEKRPDHE